MERTQKPKEVWCLQYFGKGIFSLSKWRAPFSLTADSGQTLSTPVQCSLGTTFCGGHGDRPLAEGLTRQPWETTVFSPWIRSLYEVHGFELVFICCWKPGCKQTVPSQLPFMKTNKTTELWCTPSAICPVYSSGNYICFSLTRAQQEPK